MSKINFPKKQEQRLIPKYLLEYSEELVKHHPDPSEDWGGVDNIVAGTGIEITGNKTKTISVDEESVAMVANLSTIAFSGSYNDLSNKPDLSVYELKSEAFSGDYDDLTNKPDLSVYELKSEAFSGNYNDLTNKPSIPTKTSDLTNDSGFITNSALADYETKFTIMDVPSGTSGTFDAATLAKIVANPESFMFRYTNDANTYVTLARNDGTYLYYQGLYHYSAGNKIFCRVFRITISTGAWTHSTKYTNNLVTGTNDGTNWTSITIGDTTKSIPSGGSNYTAGTGIDITNNEISIDNTVALKSELFSGNYNDLTGKPDLTVYELKADAFSGDYTDLTNKPDLSIYETKAEAFSGSYNDLTDKPTLFSGDYDDLTNKPDLSVYELKTDAFSGDYDDLTNKPTIPTVNDPTITFTQGGVTKGTITLNQSSNQTIALDAGGSAPTNMVTTDTAQTITGAKTFTTNPIDVVNNQKGIKLHSGINNSTNSKLGFTLFNSTAGSTANEVGFLESNTAPATNNGHSTLLGYYNTSHNTAYSDWDLGFGYNGYNTTKGRQIAYKLMVPNQYNLNAYNTKRYIPIDFTNGTNTVRSDATGIVDISTLLPTIPTLATVATTGSYNDLTDKPVIPTPTILYDVPNGEDGVNPITMSDSFANYDYVDIQYRNYDNANQVKSVRIYNPNGKEVYVDWSVLNNGYIYAKKSIYILNGNTMTVKTGSDMQAYYSNDSKMGVQVTATAQYQLQIKITKVVGWKDSRLS